MGFINSGVILAQPNGRPTNLSGKDIFTFIAEPAPKLVKDELLDKQYSYPQNSSFIDEVGKHSFIALSNLPNGSKNFLKKVHFDNNIRKVPTDYFKSAEQINFAV